MKEAAKKHGPLLLALAVILAVCLLFAQRKNGMFIDEIYTYGLSNSHYAPFLEDVAGGELEGAVLTRQDLLDYVTVGEDELFDLGSVYYNQVHDVHPPLYYWLFHLASCLTPGVFSKWTGLILDLVLYLLTLIALYRLCLRLFGSRLAALTAVLLYGLSGLGLSTMLMIRMYVLITLFSVLLALWISRLMEDGRPVWSLLSGLTIFLGLLTQYYFVFYAFFLCAAYVLWALVKRQYKALAWFVPCALIGAASLILVFPAALDHLFSGKLVSGESAMDNLKNFAQYPVRLRTFTGFATHGLKAAIYTALICIGTLCGVFPRLQAASFDKRLNLNWLVFIIPAVVTFVLVAVISPVDEARYIYNLIPAFVLAVGFLLDVTDTTLGDKTLTDFARVLTFLAITVLALYQARSAPPDYLYPEHAEYNAMLEARADAPCVYFSDNHFEPLTEDLIQLLTFDEVYVTDDQDLAPMLDYVGDADEVVVYIDTSVFWSSGYDADEILGRIRAETDYKQAEELFTTGLSTTYVISK